MFSVSLFTTLQEPLYITKDQTTGDMAEEQRFNSLPQSPLCYFLAGKTAEARIRPLTTIQCRGQEWVEQHLHSPVCLMAPRGFQCICDTTIMHHGVSCMWTQKPSWISCE
jgi:hypothetical protein